MNLKFEILNLKSCAAGAEWLPDMDSNHDKLLQRQLCYRYTIGQTGANRLPNPPRQSSRALASHHSLLGIPDSTLN